MILHLQFVPGFWIAVEERQQPAYRTYPLVIAGLDRQRGTVYQANQAALHQGVRAGMTLAQAHQQCPDARVLSPNPDRYRGVWKHVLEVLEAMTPTIEPLTMGQALLDLTGRGEWWSDAWQAAWTVRERVRSQTGLTPVIGAAANTLVARIASHVAGAEGILLVDPGQEALFLADLPLDLLPDVDPRLALTLQALGLRTCGQIATLPTAAVKQRFGAEGERLHRAARGVDTRPVLPPPAPPAVCAQYRCEDASPEEMDVALHHLTEEVGRELERRRLAGRLLTLTLVPGPEPSLLGHRVEELPSPPPRPPLAMSPEVAAPTSSPSLPIPYRIHSMLPQPPLQVATSPSRVAPLASAEGATVPPHQRVSRLCTALRLPACRPSDLGEPVCRLLMRLWQGVRSGYALELRVSEFERPTQMTFAELNRLDQAGALAGISPERLDALARQEEILAARHGQTPFCHVASVHPDSILTERRVRWERGLRRRRA